MRKLAGGQAQFLQSRPYLRLFAGCAAAVSSAVVLRAQQAPTLTDWALRPLKPHSRFTPEPPPQSPEAFNPDTGRLPIPESVFAPPRVRLQMQIQTSAGPPPLPPQQFNPDPGATQRAPSGRPLEFRYLKDSTGPDLDSSQQLPRQNVRRATIVEEQEKLEPTHPTVPPELALPRTQTRYNESIRYEFHNPDLPLSQENIPPYMVPRPDRWRVGFAPWQRYTHGDFETPYETPVPKLWHPYKQSILKGDVPVIGQDIFLNLTASSTTEFEARRLPTPAGVSAARPDSAEFFGRGEQLSLQQYVAFSVDLFKGETAFRPVTWALHLQPVYNFNYLHTRETGIVSPDPRGPNARTDDDSGIIITDPTQIPDIIEDELEPVDDDLAGSESTTRRKQYVALQEAFLEIHLADLSDNYDFIAARGGNQVFNSDFRGFIFNDVNLGLRFFGNAANNRYQYNAAIFDMREKETNSELNTFDDRDQRVFIANVYRQDFIWPGYTAQFSFHANFDDGDLHYDRNGNIVRPAPLGTVREHDLTAYYLGWAGDGHIGPINLSHAFYQVLGEDDFNGLAGRPVDISAQMAALELSIDRDWVRYKGSFFYASGDSDAEDGSARGFDSILDNPNFTGGPFSYYVRQGFNFGGTAVGLKPRASLIPNLRSSKSEGQANFVNPGVFLYGVGLELELTPKLRSFANANYIHFANTNPLETALVQNGIAREIGVDLSLGFQYRPFLTDNIIISTGFGTLLPGAGYKDIYRRMEELVPGFNTHGDAGSTDDFLYSGLFVVTLTF